MKPITKGQGNDVFTLYYPLMFSRETLSIQVNDLIAHLNGIFPIGINIGKAEESEKKGIDILKVTEINTYEKAVEIFDRLNLFFLHVSIENYIAIFPHEAISNFEERQLHFPSDWQAGVEAGWSQREETDFIITDGVASIVYPVILPERKRIVDSGAFMLNGKRLINSELICKIAGLPSVNIADKKKLLASKSYIVAFSHNNLILRYLGLVTCLELFANQRKKDCYFTKMVKASLDKINLIETNNQKEADAIQELKSLIGKQARQSISEALEALIIQYNDNISNALPTDHPYRASPSFAVKEIYKVRSKIAHSGSLGSMQHEKFHRALEFVKITAKTIIKDKLNQ
ncbi:MAG: hypothetical protein PHI97_27765 [Desulfobulbus sp.]|nr:hypothetical protein [Desulfobulbus sp.]